MREPPGEPITSTSSPSASNTMVGAIELRGRLPASTRLATGRPSSSGAKEKSVSSLLSRKPPTIRCEPKPASIVVVSATRVALGIDDRDMAGRRLLGSDAVGRQLGLRPGRVAGRHRHRHARRRDGSAGPRAVEIGRVEQPRRHAGEIGVGHVESAVGIGQLARPRRTGARRRPSSARSRGGRNARACRRSGRR